MNKFFTALFSIRYLAIVAVIGTFLGAALMFLFGATNVVDAYRIYFEIEAPEGAIEAGEAAMITLVASVDHFLFATILMIFGVGLYALLFSTSSSSSEKGDDHKHPSWNRLKNLGGMDEMLLKVIIMLLAVSFLEFVLTAGMGSLDWTDLVVPLSALALGLCLRWLGISADASEEQEFKREELLSESAQFHEMLDTVERLAALRDKGALSDEEYATMKARITG